MDVNVVAVAGLKLSGFDPNSPSGYPATFQSATYDPSRIPDLHNVRYAQQDSHWSGPFAALAGRCSANAAPDKLSVVVKIPGLYCLDNLSSHTVGKFDTVLFLEPGTYSLASIYKTAQELGPVFDNFRTFIPDDTFANALQAVKHLSALKYSVFSKVIPIGASTLEELHSHSAWKDIFNLIKKTAGLIEVTEKTQEETLGWEADLLKINGRFIPALVVMTCSTGYHPMNGVPHKLYWIDNDKKPVDAFAHAFEKAKQMTPVGFANQIFSPLYNLVLQWCSNRKGTHGATKIRFYVCHYDLIAHDFVLSQELEHDTHCLIRDNLENFKSCDQFGDAMALYQPDRKSGYEFRDTINKYFIEHGFPGLKVAFAYPTIHKPFLQVKHYKNEDGLSEHIDQDWTQGFWIQVSYKDKPILGVMSHSGGCLSVQDDGRISLIESSWCQRVGRWTKHHTGGIIDQFNKGWQIVDWLVGPFAEQFKIAIDEAPVVFYGNNQSKSTLQRKQDVLNKLKAGLQA